LELTIGLELFNILRFVMTVSIIIIYLLAVYWNILFLIKAKWKLYSWLKLYNAVACFLMAAVYTYYLIMFIGGTLLEVTITGVLLVRPVILLLGGSLASNSRARYICLTQGGENWTLLK